jgi:oxaloacetate decarboxylase gamma subunit
MQPEVAQALAEAANLLLVGMIVVFSFLSMLIGAINLIAWLNRLIPDPSIDTTDMPSFASNNAVPAEYNAEKRVSPKIVAAISAAIKQHRQ